MCTDGRFKYGAWRIQNGMAFWNRDPNVVVQLSERKKNFCLSEGLWNPNDKQIKKSYSVGLTGLCMWGKYDCLFKFEPLGKGNQGATRSLANPKDQQDIFRRLKKGGKVEQILISDNPFGQYQTKLIDWQADSVRRFNIRKLYYSLPIDEYTATLKMLEDLLPPEYTKKIAQHLEAHYAQLKKRIENMIETEIEFIYPMRIRKLSVEESYLWPYQNLKIDIGLEEMEEIRIPYQVVKNGYDIPPVYLAVLANPCPYYESRESGCHTNLIPF
jgi:hypothetical protein